MHKESVFDVFMSHLNKCNGTDFEYFQVFSIFHVFSILPTVIGQLLFFKLSHWQSNDRVVLRVQPQADKYCSVHKHFYATVSLTDRDLDSPNSDKHSPNWVEWFISLYVHVRTLHH